MTRNEILDIAEHAGFGMQMTYTSNKTFIRDVWGGSTETLKVIRFAQLIVDEIDRATHQPAAHASETGDKS